MAKIRKKQISPRQKMINLMYVVLMAMLALNVSNDVLKGFTLVAEKLELSTKNSADINGEIYKDFAEQYKANPTKVGEWYERAQKVRTMSDSLYNLADELKMAIVRKADGARADVHNIRNGEDLEAASQVMLSPLEPRGKELYNAITIYRGRITKMVSDPKKRRLIETSLGTDVPKGARAMGKNWQEYIFEATPVAAAVTMLTKLQNDVRYAEGEVLHELIGNIDMKDIRVNQVNAYVIPNSRVIVQGGRYEAQIIMAAVDTTSTPSVYVGGREITNSKGIYETVCSSTGEFTISGFIEMLNGEGRKIRREFSDKYTVIPPAATLSADLMNVLYAGYDNPISVSVPGVPTSRISLSMTGGSLVQKGDGHYIARPTNVGGEAVFTVIANHDGRSQEMGKFTYRVRKLPDPTAFIPTGDSHFMGGKMAKAALMAASGLGAAIDDGLLNIPFQVLGFETVFFDNLGNAVPEVSAGSSFTDRQKNLMRGLSRGKRFFITKIRAQGPDGVQRTLNGAIEVIVN